MLNKQPGGSVQSTFVSTFPYNKNYTVCKKKRRYSMNTSNTLLEKQQEYEIDKSRLQCLYEVQGAIKLYNFEYTSFKNDAIRGQIFRSMKYLIRRKRSQIFKTNKKLTGMKFRFRKQKKKEKRKKHHDARLGEVRKEELAWVGR